MVELLPVEESDDLLFIEALMRQFHDKTGSKVAARLLADWPAQANKFVKVRISSCLSVSCLSVRYDRIRKQNLEVAELSPFHNLVAKSWLLEIRRCSHTSTSEP